jgi:hypothetical protein
MAREPARKGLPLQGFLLLLPLLAFAEEPAPVAAPTPTETLELHSFVPTEEQVEPNGKLQFGDSEVDWSEESPTPAPAKPVAPAETAEEPAKAMEENPKLTAAKKLATPEERVRAIVASVKPGDEYPEEFSELVRMADDAVPTLVEIFGDSSQAWQARWMAAMSLGRIGGAAAQDGLKAGLNDSLFLVRMASVTAFGNMGDRALAPMMRKSLDDKALVVRSAAVDALAKLRDLESVPLLMQELSASRNVHRGRSLWIREHIVKALGELGDDKAVPSLVKLLEEKSGDLVQPACDSLARIVVKDPPKLEPNPEACAKTWTTWWKAQKNPPKPTVTPTPNLTPTPEI